MLCCGQLFDVSILSREQEEKRTLPQALRRDKLSDVLLLYQDLNNSRIIPSHLVRFQTAR